MQVRQELTDIQSYLVDTYLHYSASAFSVNTTIRSLVAAAFPLFTTQMFNKVRYFPSLPPTSYNNSSFATHRWA